MANVLLKNMYCTKQNTNQQMYICVQDEKYMHFAKKSLNIRHARAQRASSSFALRNFSVPAAWKIVHVWSWEYYFVGFENDGSRHRSKGESLIQVKFRDQARGLICILINSDIVSCLNPVLKFGLLSKKKRGKLYSIRHLI